MANRKLPNPVEIVGDIAYLITTDRNGRRKVGTVLDAEDVPRVLAIGRRWSSVFKDGNWRIGTIGPKGWNVVLPRVILGLADHDRSVVDHINRNTLDNRKCNLRAVTHGENMHNRPPSRRNKTGDKNVQFNKATGKYAVRLHVNKRYMGFGSYATLEEAIEVAKQARREFQPACVD